MQKRHANPKMICPKCRGVKERHSKQCESCRWPRKTEKFSRQRDVVIGLAKSQTLKEIAYEIGLSVKTIEFHWGMAKARWGLQCYQDAVKYALREGWIAV